jgi:hypothetical protein
MSKCRKAVLCHECGTVQEIEASTAQLGGLELLMLACKHNRLNSIPEKANSVTVTNVNHVGRTLSERLFPAGSSDKPHRMWS